MNITAIWDVASCILVDRYQRLGGSYLPHYTAPSPEERNLNWATHGRENPKFHAITAFLNISTPRKIVTFNT
jgi:hypothetical protein